MFGVILGGLHRSARETRPASDLIRRSIAPRLSLRLHHRSCLLTKGLMRSNLILAYRPAWTPGLTHFAGSLGDTTLARMKLNRVPGRVSYQRMRFRGPRLHGSVLS